MSQILGMMLTVANIKKMTHFFMHVLSFEKIDTSHIEGKAYETLYGIPGIKGQFAILRLGEEYLYLMEFEPLGKPYPPTQSHDLWFQHIAIVVSDLGKAHHILSQHGITAISEGPVTIPEWNEAAAGIQAFYFRSPEGHPLELIYFPPKKGRQIWQEKDRLFLGIDHTAITISDTQKSLHFYKDILGMTVFGESLNHGDTQEALSGVMGAKVKITGLGYKEVEGMGLEFLHYLHPTHGLPFPNLKANDLASTYTVIEVDNLPNDPHLPLLKGLFSPRQGQMTQSAAIAKDSDGHRLLFVTEVPRFFETKPLINT